MTQIYSIAVHFQLTIIIFFITIINSINILLSGKVNAHGLEINLYKYTFRNLKYFVLEKYTALYREKTSKYSNLYSLLHCRIKLRVKLYNAESLIKRYINFIINFKFDVKFFPG